MDILEEFKQQSEKLRQDREQTDSESSGLHTIRCMKVVNSLQDIHNYLHNLVEELNFVEPDIQTSFVIENLGELEGLIQHDYSLLNETSGHRERIRCSFVLTNDSQLELEVKPTIEIKEQLETLKTQGLLVNYTSHSPIKVTISGYVPVCIDFESDFEESNIQVTISNFSRLSKEHYMLNVDHIGTDLLNELGKFLLRRENSFMDVLVEDSHGISLVQRRPRSEESDQTMTEEMDTSRLRSLFNREHRLYLTYHNTIKDLGSRNTGCILGRAKDCDLMIKSDLASRHHAQLVYRKGKFVLIDQSTNGTFVKPQNGKEVYVQSEETPLSGSGFISLGKAVTVDNEHLIYYSCQ